MSSPSKSSARADSSGDTIAALATAPGRGSVGIVRVSGPAAAAIAVAVLGRCPPPRRADYLDFKSASGEVIDRGIALFFRGPNSFTGEDILELQGHGGPVIMDQLLSRCLECGARQARPGEFSERAFLNDKLDLAQAEAIADLINASSTAAARQAMATLKGVFSTAVEQLADAMVRLRVYVEAAIDFPEEEIDFLGDGAVAEQLTQLQTQLTQLLARAEQGAVIREGLRVALVGRPNAGKSSLLNALAGEAAAIVTDIPGTTRDVLRREVNLDGLVIQLADTAGLRTTVDPIEHEGIARAQAELASADLIALLIDISAPAALAEFEWLADPDIASRTVIVYTKCDRPHPAPPPTPLPAVTLSAQTGAGLDQLVQLLKQRAGIQTIDAGGFSARRRHLQSLRAAAEHLHIAAAHLQHGAGELIAEELRLAHDRVGEITGKWRADDLLGEIFGSFCIGK